MLNTYEWWLLRKWSDSPLNLNIKTTDSGIKGQYGADVLSCSHSSGRAVFYPRYLVGLARKTGNGTWESERMLSLAKPMILKALHFDTTHKTAIMIVKTNPQAVWPWVTKGIGQLLTLSSPSGGFSKPRCPLSW